MAALAGLGPAGAVLVLPAGGAVSGTMIGRALALSRSRNGHYPIKGARTAAGIS